MITVYTLPNCSQCDSTKRLLDKGEIEYTTVDLSQSQEAIDLVRSLGYSSAPVVITDNDHWGGFRLEKIRGLLDR